MMNLAQEKSDQTDEELMLAFKQGNQQAFTQLYQRYAQLAFAYIIKNTGNNQNIACDISQEVWRSIIQTAINYEVSSSFKTYLFKIISSKIFDHYRQFQRKPAHQSLDPQTPELNAWLEDHLAQDDSSQNPEDIYIRQSEISDLNAALAQLSPHHRQILLQHYGLEMSLSDIAAEMNVSLECAKSRLRYARQQLGLLMKDE